MRHLDGTPICRGAIPHSIEQLQITTDFEPTEVYRATSRVGIHEHIYKAVKESRVYMPIVVCSECSQEVKHA